MADSTIAILTFVNAAALGVLIAPLARRLTDGFRESNTRINRDIAMLRQCPEQPLDQWPTVSTAGASDEAS